MLENKSRRIFFILMFSMLAVSAASGYFMAKATASPLQEEEGEKLLEDCVITHKYKFLMCGSSFTKTEKIKSDYIGLTKEELKDNIPDGRITGFSSGEVTITHDIRQYCSKHYILTLENGELLIFQNISESSRLEEICNLGAPYAILKSSLRERLANGMVFSDINKAKEYALKDIYK